MTAAGSCDPAAPPLSHRNLHPARAGYPLLSTLLAQTSSLTTV